MDTGRQLFECIYISRRMPILQRGDEMLNLYLFNSPHPQACLAITFIATIWAFRSKFIFWQIRIPIYKKLFGSLEHCTTNMMKQHDCCICQQQVKQKYSKENASNFMQHIKLKQFSKAQKISKCRGNCDRLKLCVSDICNCHIRTSEETVYNEQSISRTRFEIT